MLHFFHHPQSPYSRKVFFLLEESKQPFDLQTVALEKKDQKKPDYLAINPSGRVPAIRDADFTLGESNAILRYLVRRYDLHKFYPVGLQEQAVVDMWWEYCATHINRPLMDLAWHKLLIQKYGGKPDAAVMAKAEKNLERDLPVLDRHLLGRNYIAGAELSLADINLMPFAYYAKDIIRLDDFPAFRDWISRVGNRATWKTVVAYSG